MASKKDYHYNVWYDYSVDIDVVSEEDIGDAFERLEKQVDTKEANGGTCTSNLSGKYDVTYYKEPEVTEYVLDRNTEYTTVLAANDTIRVYEDNTLLQTDDTIEVTGLNETIVASVEGSTVESYRYDDYGQSENIQGHGYNGEVKDETGLIYLRARYYDPDMGRFIQIDNNYSGEKEEVVTQNRYTYTLNNPYKYVDRDGNRPRTENNENDPNYNPVTGQYETTDRGYMPARWLRDYNSLTAFTAKVKKDIPEVYRADALTYWFKRGNYSKNDNRKIKLKTVQQKKQEEKQDDQTITDRNNGDKDIPNPKPPKPVTNLEADCPMQMTLENIVKVLKECIDWGQVFIIVKDKVIKNLFDLDIVVVLAKHTKEGYMTVGHKISATKAIEVVKHIKNLPVKDLKGIAKAIGSTFKSDFKKMFSKSISFFNVVLASASDILQNIIDAAFHVITWVKCWGMSLGAMLYNFIKEVAAAAVRTLLYPLIGPFAWVVTLLVDVGAIIDWFIDLEGVCDEIGIWVAKQSWSLVKTILSGCGKLL